MIAPDRTSYSPHFTAAKPSRKQVIIHATRSGVQPRWPLELEATLNHFANPYPGKPNSRASSHWVIGPAGEKVRVVSDNLQAWHAGEDNLAFGIEVCQSRVDDPFSEAQIEALIEVCAGYCTDFGVPAVHAAGSGQDGFLGHEESSHGKRVGKTDPGPQFPWVTFIDRLRAKLHPMGPEPAPRPYSDDDWGQAQWAVLNAAQKYGMLRWNSKATLKDLHPADREHVRRFLTWAARELA